VKNAFKYPFYIIISALKHRRADTYVLRTRFLNINGLGQRTQRDINALWEKKKEKADEEAQASEEKKKDKAQELIP